MCLCFLCSSALVFNANFSHWIGGTRFNLHIFEGVSVTPATAATADSVSLTLSSIDV
ncbi:hypothetical protein PF005_g20266 [Phytophthora fragariae]|uniref:Uncharacterized protein n=1 Tax=Phytophthora fragariae TaxID=53985 RepID=A0A6A4C052_9STRA|nr:hypothetical protein PF003_g12765 [Phytophthora fragariae]KAE8928637.1 hypothetical protein PF009_g21226 [Phytophthora fragariae]KAE8979150.1 hypothetical protein PF011_g22968 [Phytophthora fragariae]KAE9088546.1 hypothetical protein PF007_g19938 [Phytophthora fragariae]KAE9098769.1 hypothetical protein PF006_g23289 [Phytophthora fragariae]